MEEFVYAKGARIEGIAFFISIIIVVRVMPWHAYGIGMNIFGGLIGLYVTWMGTLLVIECVCLSSSAFIKFLLKIDK